MRESSYKNYQRNRRQYTMDNSFVNGMMFTNSTVEEGFVKTLVNYDIKKESNTLTPRAGLRLTELAFSNVFYESTICDYHNDTDITILAARDCVQDGQSYKQIILGRPPTESEQGRLWVYLGEVSEETVVNDEDSDIPFSVDLSFGRVDVEGEMCTFLTTPLKEMHRMPMEPESKTASIVGSFGFGNRFYFINPEKGLQYTNIEYAPTSMIETVVPKELGPSEAVTFGYNMLLGGEAYTFINEALEGIIQLTGIMPYSSKEKDKLLLTPKHNEDIYFRCNFKGQIDKQYKFVWEWRNVGDDVWHSIQTLEASPAYKIVSADATTGKVNLEVDGEVVEHLEVLFKAPTSDILVRVQAYNVDDLETVEKAMTVGFDFSDENYKATSNLQQEVYDLTTATGMVVWKNRLVLWGLKKDPTILFLSDINEPAYFPYPNNISVFDNPIVAVKEFLDSLLVFTSTSVYQVTMNSDGTSWESTLLQSDLNIEPWDRHLIQVVRNMVFFKSGDYYYMLVPRAQSTTGKLVLAPISNTIIDFFNNFEKNVESVLKDTFDFSGELGLVNCFNFLDYEDIHNMYVFSFDNSNTGEKSYLHFDLLYSTSARSWRIHLYEAPYYLFPFKQDATKRGVLAATTIINLEPPEDSWLDPRPMRCIQFYTYDDVCIQDNYIPKGTVLQYDGDIGSSGWYLDLTYFKDALITAFDSIKDTHVFNNWQFLDTGYRNDSLERNKRYRELQFQLNNTDHSNLEFGLEFQIDGQTRMSYYEYTIEHVVDENDPNYGLIYIQATPKMNLPIEGDIIPNETVLGNAANAWRLDQSSFPEVSLWKVRTPVSGKGAAPRIRLVSRNQYRFELMNINWIYRLMNMR